MKKIYIAGKVSGLTEEEYTSNFNKYEIFFKKMGYEVENPVSFIKDKKADYDEIMIACLKRLKNCDALFLMPNWRYSAGAKEERRFAIALGIRTIDGVEGE